MAKTEFPKPLAESMPSVPACSVDEDSNCPHIGEIVRNASFANDVVDWRNVQGIDDLVLRDSSDAINWNVFDETGL